MARALVSIGLVFLLSGCGNSNPPGPAATPGAPGAPSPGAAPGAAAAAPGGTAPGAPAKPPAPPPPAPPRGAPTSAPTAKDGDRSERPLPPTTYEPRGRRDPFQHVEVPKGPKPPAVAATRLTGIVRNETGALALVESADGIGYVLRPGDTLLDGRLVEIGADSVVFTVLGRPGPPERVTLRLPAAD